MLSSKWIRLAGIYIVCLALGAAAGYLLGISTVQSVTITGTVTETITRNLTVTITITTTPGLPNPAAVYCVEQGYRLDIIERQEGQYGVCIFPDGSECEEWALYRGECSPKENLCGEIEACNNCPPITYEEIQQGWYWGDCSQKKPLTPGDWIHTAEGTRSAKWIRPTPDIHTVCDCKK